ncbi:hypothetical protein BGZ49_008835 [Haplosporangium sp. Z 27]|nr:hypothetical protein BGZ49_008835 [Haplosporangium sp. Z 27]
MNVYHNLDTFFVTDPNVSLSHCYTTKTRGIFRVSGSAKRVSELQLIFDTPPHYGSQLDWTGYTIHDASNVLRRYLNHLPDPVITLEYYEEFRNVYRNLTDDEEKIAAYQELISKLPPPHSCLLMYLLDMLALFAHHSDENLMDSRNLASVFQPGVLSHPDHSMSPGEYMTSAAVVKFLIDNQSSFTMPTPNIDDDDEDLVVSGLVDHPPRQDNLKVQRGGYVTASDYERMHNIGIDRGVSFEADDAVHILNTGVRRQLSLHKPIVPHSTLPDNPPQRSRSTNSNNSSGRSSRSSLFSSNLLAKRQSNRASKVGSKIINENESISIDKLGLVQDPAVVPEKPRFTEEDSQLLSRRGSSIRKAATSPPLGSEGAGEGLSLYLSRRKQLKAEGVYREPSVICQEIEIQFPAPVIAPISQLPLNSTVTSTSSSFTQANLLSEKRTDQPIDDSSSNDCARESLLSTAAHVHTMGHPLRQGEDAYPSTQGILSPNSGQKRISGTGQFFKILESNLTPSQRPGNIGIPIVRAKSNPGELTSVGSKNPSYNMSDSNHTGSSHAMEKFKGLFTGKHRDHDSGNSQKEIDSKDSKKDKRRESLTEKQRKYMSQEVKPSYHQGSSTTGWKITHAHDTIEEHESGTAERAYARPPPPPPQQSGQLPPQRPPPPPPESSLMDLFDPPQRVGQISGYSTPTEGPRSASPARSPSSTRHPLTANASFASTASIKSMSSSDRLYHGKGHPLYGSSGSLEFVIPNPEDSYGQTRQRLVRSGHTLQNDSQPNSQLNPDHYSQYQQQQSPPSSLSYHNHHHHQQNLQTAYNPVLGSDNTGSTLSDRHHINLSSPQLVSRSRQSSFGSIEVYDPNIPPTPAPKSKDRLSSRDGSSSSIRRGDVTPPRARSNSSRNPSPINSPALKPLSRNVSNQSIQSNSGAGYGYSHIHQHQHQHHVPSPLAEGQITNYASPPPSARARNRAYSRDEQHILDRQQSSSLRGSPSRGTYRERERSLSRTGLAIATQSSNNPLLHGGSTDSPSKSRRSSQLASPQVE